MIGALVYLRLTSFKNWLVWRARRLREPKYLVGAIVGIAYFYFFFFRHVGAGAGRHPRHPAQALNAAGVALPTDWQPVALAIGAVALLVVMTFMWVVPAARAALGFTEAEIAFLFPAPVSRRALVHFRLLSSQARSLTGALVMALIANRWDFLGGNAATHAIGWWFIFSSLNLHFNGASFTLTRLGDLGLKVWLRRILVLLAVVGVLTVTLARIPAASRWPAADGLANFRGLSDWLVGVSTTAPLHWLLLPLRWTVGPFLAPDLRSFALSFGPALAVVVLQYFWVVRSAVAFEEASIELAHKRATRVAALRSGERHLGQPVAKSRPAPFPLGGIGRPELAFLWKNLLSTRPYFNLRVFGGCAVVITALALWLRASPTWSPFLPALGISAAIAGVYLLIVGPQFARQDIRSDIRNLDILKTYPIAGWQVVLGELLTPVAILTGLAWLGVLAAALALPAPSSAGFLTPAVRVAGGLGIALVAPALVALQLLVPNAAAIVFPTWFEVSRGAGGGPEVMGQRMIFFFAQLLTMVIVLLPAAVMALLLGWLVSLAAGLAIATFTAAWGVAAVLVIEVAAGVWWLGRRFEKLDVSAELRP